MWRIMAFSEVEGGEFKITSPKDDLFMFTRMCKLD
jgi:hypothetical protein